MARKVSILNKRELITTSASKLFSHYGFEKTTLDDIAKHAGIGKGTIYSEFNSKEEIMNAVISDFMQNVNQRMKKYISNAEGSTMDILKELLIQRILMYYNHAQVYFHGAEVFTYQLNNIEYRKKANLEIEKIIADLLETAFKKGEINCTDNYLKIAKNIRKALISFHPPLVLEFDNKNDVIEEANDIINLITQGLTKKQTTC